MEEKVVVNGGGRRRRFVMILTGLCCGLGLWQGAVTGQLARKGPFEITPVTDSVFVFTSYGDFGGKFYPANGLYALTSQGAVIIDGPWDPHDRQPLLDSIWQRHRARVIFCLATHFHDDRSGAFKEYGDLGIPTYATRMTDSLLQLHHKTRAAHLINQDTTFRFGSLVLQTFYPGPGHSKDNIVVWLPAERLLYGGCFLKSVRDKDLGNLEDADIRVWSDNARKLRQQFPDPSIVVVGHGDWHSLQAVTHTIELAEAAKGKLE